MEIGKKIGKIENEELIKAVDILKNDNNRENFKPFVENLMKAVFILPATVEQMPGENETDDKKKNVKVNFRIITDQNKKNFFPCFTDEAAFDAGIKDDKVTKIALAFDELSSMLLNSEGKIDGFVINPYTVGMQVPVDMLKVIEKTKKKVNSNVKKQPMPANTKIRLRTPKYMPIDMLEKAKEYFAEHQNVNAAYIQMMEKPEEEDEYLIAIDFDGDEHELFDGLMPKIKDYSFGIRIALVGTDNDLGKKVAENAEPFYEKNEQ